MADDSRNFHHRISSLLLFRENEVAFCVNLRLRPRFLRNFHLRNLRELKNRTLNVFNTKAAFPRMTQMKSVEGADPQAQIYAGSNFIFPEQQQVSAGSSNQPVVIYLIDYQ